MGLAHDGALHIYIDGRNCPPGRKADKVVRRSVLVFVAVLGDRGQPRSGMSPVPRFY